LAAYNEKFLQLLDIPKSLLEKQEVYFENLIRYNVERGEYGPGNAEQQVAEIVARTHHYQPHQFERVRANGTALEIRGMPLPDGGFVTIYIDITERKRAEERIQALLREQRLIFDNAHVGIVMVRRRKIVKCNQRLAEMFGYNSPDELDGKLTELFYRTPEEFQDVGNRAYASLARLGFAQDEVNMRRRDGSGIWIMLTGRPLDTSDVLDGSIWIYTDITDRKLAETEQRIAATAFESQEGIVITDGDCVVLRTNRAFSEITGYTAEEIFGQTPRLLKSERHDNKFYQAMWATVSRTGGWQGEIWNRRKNGEVYPGWLTISSVKNSDGAISHYIGAHHDITERKRAEAEITNLAFYDPLTGLPNRRLLLDRLKQGIASSSRSARHGALLFLDLDNFKTLNDTRGHDIGDLLLRQVAGRLATCVREGDTVARLGGDEFVVMLEDLSGNALEAATQAEAVGEKILATLNQPYQLDNYPHHSTPSIGITLFVDHRGTMDDLMKRADLAMYQAKAAGRNSLRFFDPEMQAVVSIRAVLEAGLREAVKKEQFLLYYQAQVGSAGHLTGAEVLVRWQHPDRGLVSPGEFVPLAEETGLILPLGHWVLQTACHQLALWAAQPEMAHLTVSVNVSARQFRLPNFVEEVLSILDYHGADPNRLKLELTESLMVENVENIITKMSALKSKGVGFSLDDFGTGYSSLAYLKRLPLDQLKIDQSFVRDILTDQNDAAIAKMVVALAESMGLSVIAEGVETEAQRDFLAKNGCHAYQGYLFSRPLPLEQFESFVKRA
jgi:diguanylate cyclase (GGDEF)-like protein/PAS domain S-box-containing protein